MEIFDKEEEMFYKKELEKMENKRMEQIYEEEANYVLKKVKENERKENNI